MENDLILEIDNVGSISHVKIDIGKINVVGGINSSGKSTASKLLYCFLKANSPNGSELVLENGLKLLRRLSDIFRRRYSHYMEEEDEEKLRRIFFTTRRSLFHNREISLEDFLESSEEFLNIYDKYFNNQIINLDGYIQEDVEDLQQYVDNILSDNDFIYNTSITTLLDAEFNIQGPSDFGNIARLSSSHLEFKDEIDFANYVTSHQNIYPIENIFYLDSFSIFDREVNGLFNSEHVPSLLNSLNQHYRFKPGIDDKRDELFKGIQININDIIKGDIVNINPRENVYRSSINGVESIMKNTASGIKQIGVIQKLIKNHKLMPGSFLIIDEPEVSLHPDWQAKFAGVLLLLVNVLDVTLYINTHSPIFIEAIRTFAEKYDLLEETNFYITKEVSKNKFSFDKLYSDELYVIYEELGKPYDYLDDIQISNMFKDRIKKG